MAIDPAASEHDLTVHLLDHNYPVERETMANVSALLAQVADAHGARHPELHELEGVWADVCRCLGQHLRDEGPMLEPHLESSAHVAPRTGATGGTISSQHEQIAALVRRVRELTSGYKAPADGCEAYRSLFASLVDFEEDLREHVELANSVLKRDLTSRP
jgi:regulator of cell morphogenesis and NO signaling